jgi:hypothetical protein
MAVAKAQIQRAEGIAPIDRALRQPQRLMADVHPIDPEAPGGHPASSNAMAME